MVVDTSALIAIAWTSRSASASEDDIERDPVAPDTASALEAAIVAMRRAGRDAAAEAAERLEQLIQQLGIEIEPVTADQVRLAQLAYRTYGKSMHAAGLNFGDCFAYALAKATSQPLLFKGDDFAKTDLSVA